MRMGLAYQLAITFQGSGSGKTISDEDIRRQLVALSGNFLDMNQANAKIDALLGIVDNKIANASLFANLKDTDNIGKYYAAQRVQKMINALLPGEAEYNRFVSERVEGEAKGKIPLSEVRSSAQAARVLGGKYPKTTAPVLQSWWGNNVQTDDEITVASEEQGDERRQLLLNKSAATRWLGAVKRGVKREDLNKLRQKLQRESGFAIDLNTGSLYKLIYQDDGQVSTFEKPQDKPVTGKTGRWYGNNVQTDDEKVENMARFFQQRTVAPEKQGDETGVLEKWRGAKRRYNTGALFNRVTGKRDYGDAALRVVETRGGPAIDMTDAQLRVGFEKEINNGD
jgi:hypothetical protein